MVKRASRLAPTWEARIQSKKVLLMHKYQYQYLLSDTATISSLKIEIRNICTFSPFQANMSELGSPLKYFLSNSCWNLNKRLLLLLTKKITWINKTVYWVFVRVVDVCVCCCCCFKNNAWWTLPSPQCLLHRKNVVYFVITESYKCSCNVQES